MADSSRPTTKEGDRRSFLKIGAGVVAGAVVAGVATDAYLSSVIGTNNSNSSSTVSSLSNQLASTQLELSSATNALNSTAGQLTAANSQVATLSGQLSSTQAALSSASQQLASTQQQLTSASGQISSLTGQVSTLNSQVSSANAQASALQVDVDSDAAFIVLNTIEQTELQAIVSAIIPTDSTGPGAKTTGAAYFIDHQLKGLYGNDGNVYIDGPWIPANTQTPVSVNGVTYNGATVNYTVAGTTYKVVYPPTANVRVGAGTRYQYAWNKREFWRLGLAGIEAYANSAYGNSFENLSAANQTACLTDLWNNKPTSSQFGDILPSDFAYELFFMTWCGFHMDPVYGGNKGMVGWTYTGFSGANMGNFYNEGYTDKQLMLLTTPVTLKPVSLGMLQKGSP
jgi:gluconate 2-dehydrogenase gamma chain